MVVMVHVAGSTPFVMDYVIADTSRVSPSLRNHGNQVIHISYITPSVPSYDKQYLRVTGLYRDNSKIPNTIKRSNHTKKTKKALDVCG